MKKYLLITIVLLTTVNCFCQDFSNKGKDFWVGYGSHCQMYNANGSINATGGSQEMVLYFATEAVTNITVQIPGLGYSQTYTNVPANTIFETPALPKSGATDARLTTEGTYDKGIHITSDKPIVAYAHIYNGSISGATILFPTTTLGKEYYSLNIDQYSNQANSYCFFYVVATDTGTTTIEVTPSANTQNMNANQTYTFNLSQGQVFNALGSINGNNGVDLTGSKIKSVASGNGACKRIAVFSGSGKINIKCPTGPGGGSADNYLVQSFPKTAWGKNYLTAPTYGQPYNLFRIAVSDPTTIVKLNGAVLTGLVGGFYYQLLQTNQPNNIEADKPVMVAQYITTRAVCGNNVGINNTLGDPEVIYLSSVEQNISKVLLNSTAHFAITSQFVNVIIPNTGTAISSFRIDGVVPTGAFLVHPQNANYSYLQQPVSSGAHVLQSDSGFNAIAYGYGIAESYGYNAGTNIKDLYQQIGVQSQYGIETTPSVCTGSPFKFKVSLPYIPDSILWNFNGSASMQPNNNNVLINNLGNVAEDSATLVNGKLIHWYSLPTQYSFNTVGVYPITIKAYVPNADCGSEQDIDFDLTASDPPVADFTWSGAGCVAEPYQFTETTPQTPKPTYKFWWDFGDATSGTNNTSTLRNPVHLFSAPGTYTVRFASITTPGCLSDTIVHQVVVPKLPTAGISGTTTVCLNTGNPQITFTAAEGTAPFTFIYKINGGANQTINSVTGNTVSIAAPTNVAGTFTYSLFSVNNTGSTLCLQTQTGNATVTVNPLPTATIAGSTTVCLNAAAPNISFTGGAGTAPYTFTYNINGGANQTVTTTTGNAVNVPAPTNTAGTFVYNLISVVDGSNTICNQLQSGSATVVIRNLPTATIAGSTSACLNASAPNIIFTGAGGTAPYNFTYNINGGPNQTISTTTGNSVSVAAPTTATGVFNYNLISVQEAGAFTCAQNQTGIATVTINPLPTASIAGANAVCLNGASPNITFTGSGSTAPYSFTYTINGGPALTVTTTVGNTVTVSAPTNIAGTFIYNLMSVQDGSTTACSRSQTGSASIIVKALPTATISGTAAACFNSTSPNIIFTGGNGTAPYTFNYNINGGPIQTITSSTGNSVNVPAPTTAIGSFTYNLLSVQESSGNTCFQNQSGSTVITINPLPTATISGTTAVCLNAPSPSISFSGAVGLAPYTFTYNINGGPNQTVTTTIGNSVTLPVPTITAGTFTYNLVSVRDASSTLCQQAQTGSAVVVIHPLPTVNFTYTLPSCETGLINFTDNSLANAGTINSWLWNFGDPASGANNSSTLQNPVHTYNVAGNYNVTLTVTTSNGCSNAIPFTRVVTVNNRPLAGYIIPEICLSDTYAQFLDSSKVTNGNITAWQWNFADPNATVANPNTSTLQNPTHSYTATGTYNVQLIATSNNGCKDTIVHSLVVNGSFPLANFSVNNPATLCANDSVAIVNTSTVFPGSITKVEIYWDNANFPAIFQTDNFPTSGKVYNHLYPNFQTPLTKTVSIRYRAYSGGVCVNDKISSITLHAAPKVQFNAIPAVCLDAAAFQITQASETGGVPGTFVYTGTGVSSTGMFNPAIAGVGTHTLKFTFTSTAAGCVDTMSRSIIVLDTASARFSFVAPVCDGSPATFKEESVAPANVVLANSTWDFGDGSPVETHAPNSTFTHSFPAWGTYTVTMYNTSAYGCRSKSVVKTIFISPNPQPAFSFIESSVCLPAAAVSFTNNSTIADGTESTLIYSWNFGDPASGVLNTSVAKNPPAHIYNGTGPYTVTLTVKSASNCVKSISKIVNFIHPQPKAAFDFNKDGVCIGGDVSLRDLTNGLDGMVNKWMWNFGDGNTSTQQNPTHLYTSANTYNVSLYITNSQGCNSDTLSKPFIVYPYPVVDAGPDQVVLQGGSLSLQPTVTGNSLQYLWTPATYLNNPAIAAPTASNMQNDITYRLTVTAAGGCKTFDEVYVKILLSPKIPNTFSPNNDGINDKWEISYLFTYPGNKVQVFTRTGKKVFESIGYVKPWDGTLQGKSLPVDTYYYIIEPGNGLKPITGYVTIVK